MLQRAASNAYSWWWASHIRTKQSKWLEQSLQDMEEKVHSTLKLIEEDGDSFAKRAEMYYKKRPELINFVEESYRAYRALAERYDHISTELQNANSTIATVFPERVQYSIDDEEEFNSPNIPKNSSHPPTNNVPKVPTVPNRDLKGLITTTTKKLKDKKPIESRNKTAPKSGLNESEAIEEIEKLQKEILALQTVKEFVKSSYESGLKKHWEIENQITEFQERVFSLQDEFKVGKVIEDDEARTLMAEAALRSCEETLTKLEERQEKSTIEARAESKRIDDTREKLKSFKKKLLPNHQDEEEKANEEEESKISEERTELEILKKKFLEVGPKGSDLTVTELVEKIDELVGKVISLETSVSSQTALLDRLKTETNDLQAQIRTLEDDKVNLVDDKVSFTKKLREMEEKIHGLRDLNQNVEDQNKNLQTHFNEARSSLDHLSENLHSVKPDEELEQKEWLLEERQSPTKSKTPENFGKQEEREEKDKQVLSTSVDNQTEKEEGKECQKVSNSSTDTISEKQEAPKSKDKVNKHVSQKDDEIVKTEPELVASEKGDELNWQEMLLNGMEDREKILLTEYTTILRNYKEAKKNLNNIEKKNQDSLFELTVQLREQKAAVSRRDQEIRSLRQRLNLVQESSEEGKDFEIPLTQREEAIEPILIDQQRSISPIEEKLRMEIDALLDENLDFWLRFSTSFHQIQKFRNGYQDLQAEIEKVKVKGKSNKEGSLTKTDIRSELRPIYRHLTEIQTELNLWIDQSAFLKDELQRRFSSLCDIQEEITLALKAGAEEEEMKFTSHEAAKFQGEVVNMKQENNMVRDELEAGLDHVTTLQLEIKKTIANLIDELGLSGARTGNPTQFRHLTSRSRIPLRSFIFGTKPKKKPSIFSSMHPRKHHEYKSGYQM